MSTPALSLRAICSEDEPFLQRVYAITHWSMDWVPRQEAGHYIVPADG
jgi:hypothetical protein